jgi:hypothetical protein
MLPLRRRERPFPGGVVEDRAIHPAREHAIGLSQVAGLELSVATRLDPLPVVMPNSVIQMSRCLGQDFTIGRKTSSVATASLGVAP